MKLINLQVFKSFFKSGSASGILLLSCVLVAIGWANSPYGGVLEQILATPLGGNPAGVQLRYPLLTWINDGLMAVFFLMVGLEIKRELVEGELSSFRKAALPVFAALGGVLAPALIYTLFNKGTPTAGGWGIPMATDIAFALAIIGLLGKRVPVSLKIFLAALAIVDDLMAILVIALFYSTEIQLHYLVYAGAVTLLLTLFNRMGVRRLVFYVVPGLLIWYFIHHSGIHATIAGVITAFTLPTTPDSRESPLEKLEHLLLQPVNFVIMPLFALANTNIVLEAGMLEGLATPLGLGIVLGLLVGKPVGISLFSWLAVKSGICQLPTNAHWKQLIGAGMLGGIGFTMSIFIAILSFTGQTALLAEAKFAVLTGSVLSGIVGFSMLRLLHKNDSR